MLRHSNCGPRYDLETISSVAESRWRQLARDIWTVDSHLLGAIVTLL